MLPAYKEDNMNDNEDYFDEITKSQWPAGWWILPGVVLGSALLVGLGWWLA